MMARKGIKGCSNNHCVFVQWDLSQALEWALVTCCYRKEKYSNSVTIVTVVTVVTMVTHCYHGYALSRISTLSLCTMTRSLTLLGLFIVCLRVNQVTYALYPSLSVWHSHQCDTSAVVWISWEICWERSSVTAPTGDHCRQQKMPRKERGLKKIADSSTSSYHWVIQHFSTVHLTWLVTHGKHFNVYSFHICSSSCWPAFPRYFFCSHQSLWERYFLQSLWERCMFGFLCTLVAMSITWALWCLCTLVLSCVFTLRILSSN